MTKHLVTGSSGFLGSAIVRKLHSQNHEVVSIDIIEDEEISKISNFYKIDIIDKLKIKKKFSFSRFNIFAISNHIDG